jgi:hypothetical protein
LYLPISFPNLNLQQSKKYKMPGGNHHTLPSNIDVAAAALGSVYAANELGKALNDHDNKDATPHYLKALVGAAVAVGAYEMARNKTNGNGPPLGGESGEPPHHGRRLLEEAVGAFALGKDLLGDRQHHVAHLVAEALGATGLIKDIRDRRHEALSAGR